MIPLESHFLGDAFAQRMAVTWSIGVIDLHEIVETMFGIWSCAVLLEQVVGGKGCGCRPCYITIRDVMGCGIESVSKCCS